MGQASRESERARERKRREKEARERQQVTSPWTSIGHELLITFLPIHPGMEVTVVLAYGVFFMCKNPIIVLGIQ
jgi:hypothetical protein